MIKLKEIIENGVNIPKLVNTINPFIHNIVNNKPVERPVAGAVVINDEGKLLVVYSEFANQGWFCPKGGMDYGETTVEAAKREAFEESGVSVSHLAMNTPLIIKSDYVFENTLGFGSPRYNNEGPDISQAAYDIMKQAANVAGIIDNIFNDNMVAIFDELADIKVDWISRPITYHFFAYKGNDTGSSHESIEQKWLPIDEIKKMNKLHGHLKRIISVIESGGLIDKIQKISTTS
jgi:8-oxo-dGTP pyrophosphatase MutT (NUDIX family)